MRKVGALLLALPVLLRVYLQVLGAKGLLTRFAGGLVAAAVIAVVIVVSLPPAPSVAVPTSAKPAPVSAQLLDTVTTGHALTTPFKISFDAPMDPASVAAALRMTPDAAVSFSWDDTLTTLSLAPVGHWAPDTLYVVTVAGSARAAAGGQLMSPLRAVILTAVPGSGAISATRSTRTGVRVDSAFLVALDRPVPLAQVQGALRIQPSVAGTVTQGDTASTFVFTPDAPLAADTAYTVSLGSLTDTDGILFTPGTALSVRTIGAPEVVRFRPRSGDTDITRTTVLSVRFTERMDRKATAVAFKVTADGKPVAGRVAWAELGRVLVFIPASALPYSAKVVMTVAAGARSRAGAAIDASATGAFKVVKKPVPAKRSKPAATPPPATTSIGHSGGGGAVSGSWTGVEAYYLRLMNCTRTGGWVTSGGNCSSPGGRNVAPLSLSSSISSKVSRPYAKLLATRGQCDHFIGGTPGDRLRRAGFTSYRWGENLGCRSGNPYSAVLGSHLFFQAEKPYNGGHYRNLMNAEYDRAGIGVWVSGGRVRLVVDLYHP